MSPIDGDTLKEQAVFFAKKLGFNDADIDSSWINRFKSAMGFYKIKNVKKQVSMKKF